MKKFNKTIVRNGAAVMASALMFFGTMANAAAADAARTSSNGTLELGVSSVFTSSGTGVAQNSTFYSYNPDSGNVRMAVSKDTAVLLDKNTRAAVRTAYEQYLKDFDAHALNTKGSYNAYGSASSQYAWRTNGTSGTADVKATLGYEFVKGSPYFTLTLWCQDFDHDSAMNFAKQTILLTKDQAADLVGYTDEQKLSSFAVPAVKTEQADNY